PRVVDPLLRRPARPARRRRAREPDLTTRPVRSSRQASPSPALAPPRRPVCAPAAMSFASYRRPPPHRRLIMWFLTHRNGRSARPARRPSDPRPHLPGFRPRLEALEDRSLPSTFTVLNLNDAGANSLRGAVALANATPGPDTIDFKPGLTGAIALTS